MGESSSRFREITEILHRNKVMRGITPEKLRVVLEELGPTYIKLGQIMSTHSDILPKEYCDELIKLNSEAAPMAFDDVLHEIEDPTAEAGRKCFPILMRNRWDRLPSLRYTGRSCWMGPMS